MIYKWLATMVISCGIALNAASAHATAEQDATPISKVSQVFNRDHAVYFQFHTDDEVDQLLGLLLSSFPDHFLAYVDNPAQLQNDGLSVRSVVFESGQVSLLPGRLFSNDAVILVVDYRKMTVSQVAELNQLLDYKPAYNGKPLNSSVFIIAIADEVDLNQPFPQKKLPASDFWRRLDSLGEPLGRVWLTQHNHGCTKSLSEYLQQNVVDPSHPLARLPYSSRVLDFAVGTSPQELLTGGLDLDEHGEIYARGSLMAEPGGAIIYLRDAPWDKLSFKVRLASIIARNGFDSNGQCQNVPGDKIYVHADSSAEDIYKALADYTQTPKRTDGPWLRLNAANFDSALNGLILKSGRLTRVEPATHLKANFTGIEVTSTLNTQQWRRLASMLDKERSVNEGQPLGIRVSEQNQPVDIPEALFSFAKANGQEGIQLVPSKNEQQTFEALRHQFPSAYIEWLNPHTPGNELFETIQLSSQAKHQYAVKETELYKALKEGRTIILGGVSGNSNVQQAMENLLSPEPFLQRFGQFDFLNQVDIKVVWPESAKASSSVWQTLAGGNGWEGVDVEMAGQDASLSQLQASLTIDWNSQSSPEALITDVLQQHSLIYFEGPAGSGKSYLANKIAQSLNSTVPPFILNTGPHTRLEDLTGESILRSKKRVITQEEWLADGFSGNLFSQLKEQSDHSGDNEVLLQAGASPSEMLNQSLSKGERDRFEEKYIDYETVTNEGPVIKWAKTEAADNKPVILILDEGNLLQPELQSLFTGLLSTAPFISVNGHFYPLSKQHKLIITGNPGSYGGRHISPILRQGAFKINFPELDQQALKKQVALPYLNKLDSVACSNSSCDSIAGQAQKILAEYKPLLPLHAFSARDLLDGLSRMAFYLGKTLSGSDARISAALWQGFSDSLSGELDAEGLNKLEIIKRAYVQSETAADTALLEQSRFFSFLTQLAEQETRLHLRNPSTEQFARRVWLELERIKQELNSGEKHAGRHAMLIEGPAGRGKDALLDTVELAWRQQAMIEGIPVQEPLRINAGLNNWDALKALIVRAQVEGRLLIVSELNLIPTHYLEGALNDVLTGAAAPGFFLFATVNPPEYSGRKLLSTALASRFTQVILDEYTQADLEAIAAHYSDSPLAQTAADWHFQRVSSLRNQDAKAVPAVMKLIEFVNALNPAQDNLQDKSTNAELWNRFKTFYRLYMKDDWNPLQPDNQMTESGNKDDGHSLEKSHFSTDNDQLEKSFADSDNAADSNNNLITYWLSKIKSFLSNLAPTPSIPVEQLIDGDILFDPDFHLGQVYKIFAGNVDPEDYRTHIFRLSVNEALEARLISEPVARLNRIPGPISTDVFGLQNRKRYLGRQTIRVNQPQPLTSLFTREKLVALKAPGFSSEQIQVEYDPFQGFHYLTLATPDPVIDSVDVDFLIEEDTTPLMPSAVTMKRELPALIVAEVRHHLDELFDQYPEVKAALNISPELSQKEKIARIVRFTKNFEVAHQGQPVLTSSDSSLATLLELTTRQAGNCRHRSFVAALLGFYFDIPTRITHSKVHIWVEFSTDGGFNWVAYDLGGYPVKKTIVEAPVSGKEVDRPATKKLLDPENRINADERIPHDANSNVPHLTDEKIPHGANGNARHLTDEKISHGANDNVQYLIDENIPHGANDNVKYLIDENIPHDANGNVQYLINEKAPHDANDNVPSRNNVKNHHDANDDAPHLIDEKIPHDVNDNAPYMINAKHPELISKFFSATPITDEDMDEILALFHYTSDIKANSWWKLADQKGKLQLDPATMNYFATKVIAIEHQYDNLIDFLGELLRTGKVNAEQLGKMNLILWTNLANKPHQRLWMKRYYQNAKFLKNRNCDIDFKRQFTNEEFASTSIPSLIKYLKIEDSQINLKWSYQPGKSIDMNRLLERKAPFLHTQEDTQVTLRKIVFNIFSTDILDYDAKDRYKLHTDNLPGVSKEIFLKKIVSLFFNRLYEIASLEHGGVAFVENPEKSIADKEEVIKLKIYVVDNECKNKFQSFYSGLEYGKDHQFNSFYHKINSEWLPGVWKDALIIDVGWVRQYFEEFCHSLTDQQIEALKNLSSP